MLIFLIVNYFTNYPYLACESYEQAQLYKNRIPQNTRILRVYLHQRGQQPSELALSCLMTLPSSTAS